VDDPVRGDYPAIRELLGVVMSDVKQAMPRLADLDVVALLVDQPADGLARGQVGTVVDTLDASDVLVEFSDDDGRAYAIVPCACADLLPLHYLPHAA
jgi:hypothetical protein